MGSVRLSYCAAASTRNTSKMASGNTSTAELPARIPGRSAHHSNVMPWGSVSAAMRLDSGLGLARRETGRGAAVHRRPGSRQRMARSRPKLGLDLHQRRQRHHLTRAGAHLERSHVLSPRTVGRIGLHTHAVGAAKLVEVVGVEATQVDLQVSKMSVTGTPSWRALVRSMLAYSCGTLTCQLVNRPASSGVWQASPMKASQRRPWLRSPARRGLRFAA